MSNDLLKQAVSYAIAETKKIVADEWESAMREMAESMTATVSEALKDRDAIIEAQAAEIEKLRDALEDALAALCGEIAGLSQIPGIVAQGYKALDQST